MKKLITVSKATELAEQFKIAPTKAEQIIGAFSETVKTIGKLDKEYSRFSEIKEITEEVCDEAKALRLKYVKARTGADAKRKEIKAQVLLESKAIDGAGNIFKLQISEREKPLKDIEDHFEKIEEEKRQKKKLERIEKLKKFGIEEFEDFYLDQMTDDIWDSFYAGEKAKFEAEQARIKKEAEQEKELARIRELAYKRRDFLLTEKLATFVDIEAMDNIGEIPDPEWETIVGDAKIAKVKKEEDDEKVRKENARLAKEKAESEKKARKEKELAEKKLAKAKEKAQKEKLESDKKLAAAKKAAEAAQKEVVAAKKAELDRKAKEEEDKAKKIAALKKKELEDEKTKKNEKYLDFLMENGASQELIDKDEFIMKRVDNTFTLYEKKAQITI